MKPGVIITNNKLPELALRLPGMTHHVIEETGDELATLARSNIKETGAYDTGHYHNTTRFEKAAGKFFGDLLTDAYYWEFVEFGTVKMAARPAIVPAANTMSEVFHERITRMFALLT